MLLCDHCASGCHIECINLDCIPNGNFYCLECEYDIFEKLLEGDYIDPSENFELIWYLKNEISDVRPIIKLLVK